MPLKKTTKKRRRRPIEFSGEKEAVFLVNWLNAPSKGQFSTWRIDLVRRFGGAMQGTLEQDVKARKRIENLLADFSELNRFSQLLPLDKNPNEDSLGWKKFRELGEKVNDALKRYRSYPVLSLNEPGFSHGKWQPIRISATKGIRSFVWGRGSISPNITSQELHAISLIRELTDRGLIAKLRRCRTCNRWLFARKSNQHACEPRCYRKRYQNTPKYRKKRRDNYQKLYSTTRKKL